MAEHIEYRVWLVAGGRLAESWLGASEEGEALAVVRGLLSSLGVTPRRWVKLAPGFCVLSGPEAGGFCLVLLRLWVLDAPVKAGKTKSAAREVASGRRAAAPKVPAAAN